MHRLCRLFVCAVVWTIYQAAAWGDDSLTGSSLVMKSASSATMSGTGFAGTYLTVPNVVDGGAYVDLSVNGSYGLSGAGDPHMNLVVGDTKFGFNLSGLSQTHTLPNVFLPAGTYVVRAERDYVAPASASTRSATVNSLSVAGNAGAIPGLVFSNSSTPATLNTNALAAADTYIANYRKGSPTIEILGVAPGTPVSVDLVRHAFNFGTAVPGGSLANVNTYLNNGGTSLQTQFQAKLNQNFNSIVPENAGKWDANEGGGFNPARDALPTTAMGNVDKILDYAQNPDYNASTSYQMRARMHNVIWGNQQPGYVNTMLSSPTSIDSDTGLTNLLGLYGAGQNGNPNGSPEQYSEVKERIDYYIGDGPGGLEDHSTRYFAVDVYNESYHTGEVGGANTYWNRYGASGVAAIYRDVKNALAASGSTAKTFVNEYNVLADMSGDEYSSWYSTHIKTLRDAGFGLSVPTDVVGGIGLQYYVNPNDGDPNSFTQGEHYPERIMQALQNLSVHGVPLTLTEFGVKTGSTEADAAQMLEDAVRLVFGNANSDGFFMWGFTQEAIWSQAPAAALFTDHSNNGNDTDDFLIREPGRVWQDLLGIQDWDSNPNNAWDTLLTGGNAPLVDANGNVTFNGFYGDYKITINGTDYPLTLVKGTNNYQIVVNSIAGDMDDDGDVDANDIDVLWHMVRSTGVDPHGDDTGDLNGDSFLNEDDVDNMLASKLTAGANRAYGDANLSGGTPELTDYNLWRTGTGGWANGDFDGSGGTPELNDYNLWRTGPTQFPDTVGSHGGGGGSLVPEPATIVLMGLALPALLLTARRRKAQ